MKRSIFPTLLFLCAAVSITARPITETDIFRFVWIADPQIAPDGARVAFVRVTVNEKKDGYDTAIWSVATSGAEQPRQLTNGPRDSSPRWSPDGRSLAFLRALEKDGKPEPAQIHVLPMSGGEPRAITTLARGAGTMAWSPSGDRIAFTTKTNPGESEAPAKKDEGAYESDVRVVNQAVYRFNGQGYLDPVRRSHIWTVRPADEKPEAKQITAGEFDEEDVVWSPDGSKVYFTSTRVREPYYQLSRTELYAAPASGGDIVAIASIEGDIGRIAPSPDGKWIAFRGQINRPARSYNQPDLFVVSTAGGSPARNLTAGYDNDVLAGLTGDQRAPRGGKAALPIWSADSRALLVTTAERGTANLARVAVPSGAITPITRGNHEVQTFTATPSMTRPVVLVSTPTMIGDLHAVGEGGRLSRLTNVNKALFDELTLTEPDELTYKSFDEKMIQTWVQKPPGFESGRRYPLILNIHGGPHAAYGYTFFHEIQWMAAKGYVVLYPNPRGSTTYGQEFGNIIQYRYPGDDHKDLMAGVDELIRRGLIDEKKLGVTGGSGGGLLTNWAVTQTDRFAAAVSQRSISDWANFWYTADFTLFQPNWFRKAPFEDRQDYQARSPITYVDRVRTPMMFIEGELDYRTPPAAGGEIMFRALKYLRRPAVMVRFPGETHELSRSGKPWHRVERLQHIVRWFDKYLMGERTDLYDVGLDNSS
ncbi:MAG TPA: S9 family peptidase [Thermoanaerobaculia bacterium]|nr:S9 family peptidase [Thermoanaerobaculia bacterium]